MAAASSAAKDLELLERVQLRIALCDTDEKLAAQLKALLCPILLKFGSPDKPVKDKVVQILVHVSKVLNSRPQLQLPVEVMLQQLCDATVPNDVKNLTKVYLQMGLPRLPQEEQCRLAPLVLKAAVNKQDPLRSVLFRLALPALGSITHPDSAPEARRAHLGLDDAANRAALLAFLRNTLLLNNARKQPMLPVEEGSTLLPRPPPGLSRTALKAIVGDTGATASLDTADKVVAVKIGVIAFVANSNIFTTEESFPILLAGTCDAHFKVAQDADVHMSRLVSVDDLSKPALVRAIFELFLGTTTLPGQPACAPDDRRQASDVRMRAVLMPVVLRSQGACTTFPGALQLMLGCMFEAGTTAKLRLLGLQMAHRVFERTEAARLAAVAPPLLNALLKLTDPQATPHDVLGLAFTAVGKLSRKVPAVFAGRFELLDRFFQALVGVQDGQSRLCVQEALSMMRGSFNATAADPAAQQRIVVLLQTFVLRPEPHARLAAVQYANALFPPEHVAAAYVALLASADPKDEVRKEALGRLSLLVLDGAPPVALPPFHAAVSYVCDKLGVDPMSSPLEGGGRVPIDDAVFINVIRFVRHCLGSSAGADWSEERFVQSSGQPGRRLPRLCTFLASASGRPDHRQTLLLYQKLVEFGLVPMGSTGLHSEAMKSLLELIYVLPADLTESYSGRLDWFQQFLVASGAATRQATCRVLGRLAASLPEQSVVAFMTKLIPMASAKALESGEAAFLALGYVAGGAAGKLAGEAVMVQAVEALYRGLASPQPLIVQACCKALGEIGRAMPLPLEAGGDLTETVATDVEMAPEAGAAAAAAGALSKREVIQKLLQLAATKASSKESKVASQEAALAGLALLCAGDFPHPHAEGIMGGLCKLGERKAPELQFGVGAALSCLGLGAASLAAIDEFHPGAELSESTGTAPQFEAVMDHIFGAWVNHNLQSARQAAGIWLLSLVKHCPKHPSLLKRLPDLQAVFSDLLAEGDEFTQDLASKGLGLIYEMGDAEMQKELVGVLVGTLSEGRASKRRKFTQNSEDQVFARGSLGQTKDGGQLTTYKELCSLASDMNQPDLIYKFMHLANHNTMWNSRKGAAFGFSKIASQAKDQLEEFLPTLVPKLFRYQFDPNRAIQQSMGNIWKTLVPEPAKAIDKFFPQIIKELSTHITSKLWRARESCALALADVLRGRTWEELRPFLNDLWALAFRVLDDVKESVREAGLALCKRLGRVSVSLCENSTGSQRTEIVACILPCLIETGLLSEVNDVRFMSLGVIVDISDKAGEAMKPHVTTVVLTMLEALSGLESPMLNYVGNRLDESGQNALDSARVSHNKRSPMNDCLDRCAKYATEAVLPELIPKLTEMMKKGLGAGTKAGCARFASTIASLHPADIAPYTTKLLKAMLRAASDKSAPVRRDYCNAIAVVAKVASVKSVSNVLNRLKKMYMEADSSEASAEASSAVARSLSRLAPDVLQAHAASVLPVAFFGMHDARPVMKQLWEDTWSENTAGTQGGIRLYLTEILELLTPRLAERSWLLKKQAAEAICVVAKEAYPDTLGAHLDALVAPLLDGLSGRTFDGKEFIVEALVQVAIACKSQLLLNPDRLKQVIAVVIKECKKKAKGYKMLVMPHLVALCDKLDTDSFFESVCDDLVMPMLQPTDSGSDDEGDGDTHDQAKMRARAAAKETAREASIISGLLVLAKSWPSSPAPLKAAADKTFAVLLDAARGSTWKVKRDVLKACEALTRKTTLVCDQPILDAERLGHFVELHFSDGLADSKHSGLRTTALSALAALAEGAETKPLAFPAVAALAGDVSTRLQPLRDDGHADVRTAGAKLEARFAALAAAAS